MITTYDDDDNDDDDDGIDYYNDYDDQNSDKITQNYILLTVLIFYCMYCL
jgi:hypothetical protein